MLTELQTIFLTCLLGPEDKTAFARSQKNARERERLARNPEKTRNNARTRQEKYRQSLTEEEKEAARKVARETMRVHRIENPEIVAASRRKYEEKHPTAARDSMRKRRKEHPDEVRETYKKWRADNLPRVKATRNLSQRERYKSDAGYRAQCCLKNRLNNALQRARAKKGARTMELTGCPWVWLEVHLESLFKPGMTWENHGSAWQIDHVRPCASFNLADPEQQRICFHWTNLQPLFAEENLKKGDTYVVQ